MTAKDTALNLIKNNQFLNINQEVYAQWNQHIYTQPDTYGFYTGNATAEDYYVLTAANSASSVLVDSTNFSSVTSLTGLSAMNAENAVRLVFDATITAFPTSFDNIYTDYLIKITPYSGGNAQTEYIDIKTVKLNDNIYRKFEIIFVGNSEGTKFDRLDISVKACATITSGSATLSFINFSASRISSEEILELQADRLSTVFTPNRPGDQLLENDLMTITSPYSIASQYYIAMDGFVDTFQNPVNLMPTALSPFNQFKYFISPRSGAALETKEYNIFSIYNAPVKTNEIYIKTLNADISSVYDGSLSTVTVFVKESGAWSTAATISTASVIQDGSFILRWNGSSWGTGSITYPSIGTASGTLTGYKDIQGIRVKFELQSNTLSDSSNRFLRVRLIEISPRLKLNLSNFLIDSNVKSTIDEGNLPVPIGMASSNQGSITLENLPRYTSGNEIFQIFDNVANSPLNGLIMPDVKFTMYTNIYDTETSSSSAQVKIATMYADGWTNNGIETVSIALSDYAKYLQGMKAPDLLLTTAKTPNQSGDIGNIIECVLQAGGFSDYDKTSLTNITNSISNERYGKINIFFCNNEKTIWSVLSELLLGWQISYYFDSNGILNFKDLLREQKEITYSDTSGGVSGYFQLSDTNVNSFIPNISSIVENIKEPIGQLTTNYKNLSISASTAPTSLPYGGAQQQNNYSTSPWKPDDQRALDCAYLESPMTIDDNVVKAGTRYWDNGAVAGSLTRKILNFSGYGIIENEIIYWGGREYEFSPAISGFSTKETVISAEDLVSKVSARMGSTDINLITAASCTASVSTTTLTCNNTYSVGDTIYVSIPEVMNKFIVVSSRTASTFSFLEPNVPSYSITCKGQAIKSTNHVSYYPTGNLMNVQRGLFGTNAAVHQYKYSFQTSSVFKGNGRSMSLSSTVDHTSQGKGILASNKNGIQYLGFYQKDSELYTHYQFSVTPKDNLGSIGIFLGADMAVSGGKLSFNYNAPANYSTGIFIELFAKGMGKPPGYVYFGAPSSSNDISYQINDYIVENPYKRVIAGTPKLDPETKKPLKDSKGHIIWLKPPKTIISTRSIVDVRINLRTKVLTIHVNGKQVRFKNPNNQKIVKGIGTAGLSRASKSFGVFSRNFVSNTVLYINSLEAVCNGQHVGGDEDSFNTLESKNSLDYLLSPYGTPAAVQRPFSLNFKPLLRGISIYDINFNGDVPYFHYEVSPPGGLVGFHQASPDEFQISTLIGTPFRAKLAIRNRSNQVVYPVANTGQFNSLGIAGKAIVASAEQKFITNVSIMTGLQNIEINAPWCPNANAAQSLNDDIIKNLSSMNRVYQIESFGNPALEAGDYVKMLYSQKNIEEYFVISSIEKTFSDGGMATNLTLRSLNISS